MSKMITPLCKVLRSKDESHGQNNEKRAHTINPVNVGHIFLIFKDGYHIVISKGGFRVHKHKKVTPLYNF